MVVNGRLMESLNLSVGKMWIFFAAWLVLDVPTSLWRGGSLTVLWGYLPRSLMLYFFIMSFVATLSENRRLMNINIFASFLLVLNCMAFGSMKSGRLEIPDSLFFENANDLGLALLLGVCQTAYLFFRPGMRTKLWGGAVALSSLFYLMKTGSRGCFGALLLTGCVGFLLSRQKLLFGFLGTLGLIAALIATPGDLRNRLTSLVSDPASAAFSTEDELSSYGSQVQRELLLRQSLDLTVQHPVFGVGPGQFAVAVFEDSKREGKKANWLGTHNSYTQASSECGLPALFAYVGIILWTLKTSWKIHRWSVDRPGMDAIAWLSYSLLLGTIAYASGTFFFHVAYTSFLPILSGSVAALSSVARSAATRSVASAV